LLAATWGRLYASTFYALRDTRTPLRFAIVRVVINLALGSLLALYLPYRLGIDHRLGVAGLTAASGIAAWVEFYLLRRALSARIGHTSSGSGHTLTLWMAAVAAAVIAWGLKLLFADGPIGLPGQHPVWIGLAVLAAYGVAYLLITTLLGVREAVALTARLTRGR